MEIHHPKAAVQNLHELGKEIGIIVIGVLIALGAEQAVEALHWAHQMDVQRANLEGELAGRRALVRGTAGGRGLRECAPAPDRCCIGDGGG